MPRRQLDKHLLHESLLSQTVATNQGWLGHNVCQQVFLDLLGERMLVKVGDSKSFSHSQSCSDFLGMQNKNEVV